MDSPDQLLELKVKLERSVEVIAQRATEADNDRSWSGPAVAVRLYGKLDGLKLALSYLDEAIRDQAKQVSGS